MEVEEKGPEWYDNIAEQEKMYSASPLKSSYYPVYEKVVELLKEMKPEGVIDLGCGSGQLARLVFGAGLDFRYGLDFSPKMIDLARKLNPDIAHRFHCQDFFIKELFLNAGICVVMTEVLEHLEDDLKLIEKIPSGCPIIFSVPSYFTQSHLRVFSNDHDILERYGKVIRFNKIIPIVMNQEHGWKIFVCEGVKR
jgi:2-polyprenyl-3-methyl-5-hydroxy-6-metoxy-1,4-benzoquinol methylase